MYSQDINNNNTITENNVPTERKIGPYPKLKNNFSVSKTTNTDNDQKSPNVPSAPPFPMHDYFNPYGMQQNPYPLLPVPYMLNDTKAYFPNPTYSYPMYNTQLNPMYHPMYLADCCRMIPNTSYPYPTMPFNSLAYQMDYNTQQHLNQQVSCAEAQMQQKVSPSSISTFPGMANVTDDSPQLICQSSPPMVLVENITNQILVQSQPSLIEDNPTVKPASNFKSSTDAYVLIRTLNDTRPDETIIINILCYRSLEQRLVIANEFEKSNRNLSIIMQNKLSGDFKNLMKSIMTPINILNVNDMQTALNDHNFEVTTDIICTMTNKEIRTLKSLYIKHTGKTLENIINAQTSLHFKRMLIKLCTCTRDESTQINIEQAQSDAKKLRLASDVFVSSYFIETFATRSFEQIKLICQEYYKLYNESIERKIKEEFPLHDKLPFLCIARYANNKNDFFAKTLHKSMEGFRTNNKQLSRIIVTRSEIDLQDIKTSFEKMYKKSLKNYLKANVTGMYRNALYALIGEPKK